MTYYLRARPLYTGRLAVTCRKTIEIGLQLRGYERSHFAHSCPYGRLRGFTSGPGEEDDAKKRKHAMKHQLEHRLEEKASLKAAENVFGKAFKLLKQVNVAEKASEKTMQKTVEHVMESSIEHSAEIVAEKGIESATKQGIAGAARYGIESAAMRGAEKAAGNAAKVGLKKGAERTLENVAKHGAERTLENVAKHGAERTLEKVAKHGAERTLENITKHGAERTLESITKHGAEKTFDNITKHGVERTLQNAAKHGAERIGIQKGAEHALENAAKHGIESAATKRTSLLSKLFSRSWLVKLSGRRLMIAVPAIGGVVGTAICWQDFQRSRIETGVAKSYFQVAAASDGVDAVAHFVIAYGIYDGWAHSELLQFEYVSLSATLISISSVVIGELKSQPIEKCKKK